MPMAISLFAAGVIWRIMDQKDPELGAVNAAIAGRQRRVQAARARSGREPSTRRLTGSPSTGFVLKTPLRARAASRCSG